MIECVYTTIEADGVVEGSISTGPGTLAGVIPGRLQPLGGAFIGHGPSAWGYTSGRVSAGIDKVVVEVTGIGPIAATLQNGWYLAWWEGAPARIRSAAKDRHRPFRRW